LAPTCPRGNERGEGGVGQGGQRGDIGPRQNPSSPEAADQAAGGHDEDTAHLLAPTPETGAMDRHDGRDRDPQCIFDPGGLTSHRLDVYRILARPNLAPTDL
jgi:hypothetical protein